MNLSQSPLLSNEKYYLSLSHTEQDQCASTKDEKENIKIDSFHGRIIADDDLVESTVLLQWNWQIVESNQVASKLQARLTLQLCLLSNRQEC